MMIVLLIAVLAGILCFCLDVPRSALWAARQLRDDDPRQRRRAIRALRRRMRWKTRHAKLSILPLLGDVLHDSDVSVRKEAVITLGESQSVEAIPFILNALGDQEAAVVQQARKSFSKVEIWVHTVVFDERADGGKWGQDFTLFNPNVAHLHSPFSQLKTLIIHTDHSQRPPLFCFLAYLQTYLDRQYLKTHVKCKVSGNIGYGEMARFNPLSLCQDVVVSSDRIIFGTDEAHQQLPERTLENPEVAECLLPLPQLRTIIIYPETAAFHQIERFLTYGVSYIGQHHLKKRVDVHVYGNLKKLHPNVRNNLTNLCRSLYVHEL